MADVASGTGNLLTHKVGPLPLIAWVGVAGGVLLFASKRGTSAGMSSRGTTFVSPVSAQPASATAPTLVPAGQGVYNGMGVIPTQNPAGQGFAGLLRGQPLDKFINALGSDYTGLTVSDGGMQFQVSHHNSAADLALAQQQGINDVNSINAASAGQTGLAAANWGGALSLADLTGKYASLIAAHTGTILSPGQAYVPGGYTSSYTNQLPPSGGNAPVLPPSAPPLAANPPSPPPQANTGNTCNSGNFSCVRALCNSGNYSCAHSVAPWLGSNKVW